MAFVFVILAATLAFSGCTRQDNIDINAFVRAFNNVQDSEYIDTSALEYSQSEGVKEFRIFFDGILICVDSQESDGYIREISVTYDGADYLRFRSIAMAAASAYTGESMDTTEEIFGQLGILGDGPEKAENFALHEALHYRYYFSCADAGGSFQIESARLLPTESPGVTLR